MTNVFIIAASDAARAGLESLIAEESDFTIVGSGADLSDLESQGVDDGAPDIVIVDAEGLGDEPLVAMRALVEEVYEGRDAPSLVVIGAERGEWLSEALRAGVVRGTLRLEASSGAIVAALQAVSSGLIAVDAETFGAVLALESYDERLTTTAQDVDALTPREREVLDMLAEGLSNKEIASRMKISEHTVKFHTAQIFAKLGVSTRTEAVVQGIRQGLIMM